MTDQRPPAWAVRINSEREAREWGKWEMARRLLGALNIKPTQDKVKNLARQILDWEKGKHFPRDWAQAYATAFDIPHEELFGADEATAPRTGTVETSTTPDLEDDEVKRRAALQLLTAITAGAAVPPGTLEHVLSGIDDALGNPLDLDGWEAVVHEYGQVLATRPAGALVADLTADIVAVGKLLKRHRDESDQAGLLRVSAGLSGLLAIDLGDTGNQRAARVAWSTAGRAADGSGDQSLRVWVRGRAAQDAAMAGRPASVIVGLAEEAMRIADDVPSTGLARAHAARAYAATALGDTAQAHASLAALTRTFDCLPDSTGSQTSPLSYGATQLLWAKSYVQALTGDDRADETVAQALALYPPSAAAPITNLSLMQAAMLVNSGEINTGLEHAITSLRSSQGRVTSAGARLITGKILNAVPEQARALSAARELRAITAHN
ncbi:XRE family transcriptional regulator [Actinomadura sp. SCN-SB]|uniref:XRE family transcriptional regulator n=1 Tax=Actinomadura sp. SCN-SB TaxID=3373092 RepID=UPI0037507A0B